ncbi:MAG: DUF6940 family protein [Candidatus Promineifilaceae bacterium]
MKSLSAKQEPILSGNGRKVKLFDGATQLSFRAFYQQLLAGDQAGRTWLTSQLVACPFDGFFWETPSVTLATVDDPFEFVMINGAALSRLAQNANPFRQQFAAQSQLDVIRFANLGGDAQLVVPQPRASQTNYTHLGAFLRSAPAEQVDLFWQTLSEAFWQRLSAKPVWVSTAGLGVSWVHLRLDNRPKYYRHAPYRNDFGRKTESRYLF